MPGFSLRVLHAVAVSRIKELSYSEQRQFIDAGVISGKHQSLAPNAAALVRAGEACTKWRAAGLGFAAIGSADYPASLASIYQPPLMIWWRGAEPKTFSSRLHVAIVGSRNCDSFGIDRARGIARDLASAGVVVVSGLALGIDGMAHRGALDAPSGATIAVLGGGLNHVYPRAHHTLAQEIESRNGTVLSQFEPDVQPFPSRFLERNRTIVGLSRSVIVIQAATRSGALVTARIASEEGRDVCAVPGAVGDPRHTGTNALIRRGAHLIENAEQLAELYPEILLAAKPSPALSAPAAELLSTLTTHGNAHISEVEALFPHQANLAELLSELEFANQITRAPGNFINIVTP